MSARVCACTRNLTRFKTFDILCTPVWFVRADDAFAVQYAVYMREISFNFDCRSVVTRFVNHRKPKPLRKMTNIWLLQVNSHRTFLFVLVHIWIEKKRGTKLIIYVSAAELKSLNQDTNQRAKEEQNKTISIIGIYAFYININGSVVLCACVCVCSLYASSFGLVSFFFGHFFNTLPSSLS